jgi:glutamyl-tRNA reductase
LEPSLAIVGLNFRTSPVAVRERFWISEPRRYEALQYLVRSEGIDEVIVLATCNRTEFIVWASDVPTAANSVLRFLTHEYQLKLCEWSHFYRLMDDIALTHLFRVVAGLDSMVLGGPEICGHVNEAWEQAAKAETTGRFLDTVMQKAMAVYHRVHTDTVVGSLAVSVPFAVVGLSQEVLGDLTDREVLLIGAGKMTELAARYLMKAGANRVKIMNRTFANAEILATKLGATPVPYQDHLKHLHTADLVVSSTASPNFVVTRQDADKVAKARRHKPMVIIDIAVPRDIESSVREVEGIHLFDMDDIEQVLNQNTRERQAAAEGAERIVHEEVQGFRGKLMAQRVLPTIAALRQRLEELCRQELEVFRQEFGPFTEDQNEAFEVLTAHITQRIAGSLARELKELPERKQQDVLASAITRLFHLEQPEMAAAGTNT